MNFTSSNTAQPESTSAPATVTKFIPRRMSPSMAGSTSPIPGADQAVQVRGAQQQVSPAGDNAGSDEGQGVDEDVAQRSDMSSRMAILARKDRAARQALRQVSEERAAAKAELEALTAARSEREAFLAQDAERRRNPRKLLQDYGFSPEAALQFELNKGVLTPIQEQALRMDEALAAERVQREESLRALREEQEKAFEEQHRAAQEQAEQDQAEQEQVAVQEMHADIGDVITGDPDTFKILGLSQESTALVFGRLQQVSDSHFAKTGRRPPITTKLIEQSARFVEDAARKELEAANEKLGYRPAAQVVPRRPQTLSNSTAQRQAAGTPESDVDRHARVLGTLDQIFGRQRR